MVDNNHPLNEVSSNTELAESEKLEVMDAIHLAENIFRKDRLVGEPTGFASIDSSIGGLKARTLTVIAGATAMGKSILALNIFVNIAKRGERVCYFDLENGEAESFERILRIWYGKDREWFMNEQNMDEAAAMIYDVQDSFVYWDHEAFAKFEREDEKNRGYELLINLIKNEHLSNGTRFFLVDPLQSLETHDNQYAQLNQQGKIVKKLKELAQSMDISIVLCHHIRKSVQGGGQWIKNINDAEEVKYRIPSIDDLKGSAKIADFAQYVWGIVRMASAERAEDRAKTLIRILKSRSQSEATDIKLLMDMNTLQFKEHQITYANDPLDKMVGFDA